MATTINTARGILLLSMMLGISSAGLLAQQKDFQTWHEFEVTKAFSNKLDLSGEAELRLKNNSTQYDRVLFTLAASYDLTGYLRTAAGYRMVYVSGRELDLGLRQRLHTDITGRYNLFDVDLSLRFRLQYGFEELIFAAGEFRTNSFVNRNRLKADYHIFGTRIGIYATAETWGLITGNTGRFIKRMRYSAGITYALNFRSELILRYILENEINQVRPDQNYILLVGYSYSL